MEPVNKIVVLCCLLAVSAAGFLGYQLQDRQKAFEKVSKDLASIQAKVAALEGDTRTKSTVNLEMVGKLKQLNASLTQAQADLAVAQQKVKQVDETTELEKAARVAREQELRKAMAEVPAPTVTLTTNNAGGEVRTLVFNKLPGRNGQVLATRAEFLSVDGRKVFFKYGSGGGAIDVDNLHLGVLAHLGIDPDAAKALQAKLDVQRSIEESQRQLAAASRIAFYEKLKNERRETDAKVAAQKAAETASQAEADRQRKQAENERMQAEAAKTQAEVAKLNASRPPDYYNPFYVPPPTTTTIRSGR